MRLDDPRLDRPLDGARFTVWLVRLLMATMFAFTGLCNVFGWFTTPEAFRAIGLPDGVRVAVGAAEMLGAALLVWPGIASIGVIALAVVLLPLGVWRLVNEAPSMGLLTLLYVAILGVVLRHELRRRRGIDDESHLVRL